MQFLGKEAVPIYGWTEGVPVEDKALGQLKNVAALPFIHKHVAVMPDVHWGMGATVGSVIPTVGAIIPAAVGVDIGCGMMAVRTGIKAEDLPDNLHAIRSDIEAAVPHGRTDNGGSNDRGAWGDLDANVMLDSYFVQSGLKTRLEAIMAKHPGVNRAAERGAAPPRHAGNRQPLHRNLPGRGRSSVGDAAFRLARDRQQDRHLLHRAGQAGDAPLVRQSAGSGLSLPAGRLRSFRRLRGGATLRRRSSRRRIAL